LKWSAFVVNVESARKLLCLLIVHCELPANILHINKLQGLVPPADLQTSSLF